MFGGSLLTTSFTHSTTTPLPAGTTRAHVLRLLHNHVAIIELNPLVISHARTSASDAGADADATPTTAASQPQSQAPKESYAVTDKLSYFGLWEGKVTYNCEFENTEDGLRTAVRAAMGLVSEGTWKVEERGAGGLVLVETAHVSCGRLMRVFVEGTMRKSHDELCERFVERLGTAYA